MIKRMWNCSLDLRNGIFVLPWFVVCCFNINSVSAQQSPNDPRGFWSMREVVIQMGFNAIDDDNSRLKRMLDFSKWSVPIAPTRFAISKKLYDKYHFEVAFGAVRLKRATPESWYVTPLLYANLDFNFKYYQNIVGSRQIGKSTVSVTGAGKVIDNMALDVYPALGMGFQYISQGGSKSMPTFNLGGGIDWWLKRNVVALNFQAIAKFAMHLTPPQHSGNLLHYTIGACWKYNPRLVANIFTVKPKAKYRRRRNRL